MPPRKGSGKKARPSFGAARKAEPETPTSWVYRSEPEPAAPASPPVKKAPQPAKAETGGQPRLERFADWMMMPTALAIVVALAPVSWLMGLRRR